MYKILASAALISCALGDGHVSSGERPVSTHTVAWEGHNGAMTGDYVDWTHWENNVAPCDGDVALFPSVERDGEIVEYTVHVSAEVHPIDEIIFGNGVELDFALGAEFNFDIEGPCQVETAPPTFSPTFSPTVSPTLSPTTSAPTTSPTVSPSMSPTTASPTASPTPSGPLAPVEDVSSTIPKDALTMPDVVVKSGGTADRAEISNMKEDSRLLREQAAVIDTTDIAESEAKLAEAEEAVLRWQLLQSNLEQNSDKCAAPQDCALLASNAKQAAKNVEQSEENVVSWKNHIEGLQAMKKVKEFKADELDFAVKESECALGRAAADIDCSENSLNEESLALDERRADLLQMLADLLAECTGDCSSLAAASAASKDDDGSEDSGSMIIIIAAAAAAVVLLLLVLLVVQGNQNRDQSGIGLKMATNEGRTFDNPMYEAPESGGYLDVEPDDGAGLYDEPVIGDVAPEPEYEDDGEDEDEDDEDEESSEEESSEEESEEESEEDDE